jgi:hypothetical protein
MPNDLQQVADSGVAVWLDDLSRARIQLGFARVPLVRQSVFGRDFPVLFMNCR